MKQRSSGGIIEEQQKSRATSEKGKKVQLFLPYVLGSSFAPFPVVMFPLVERIRKPPKENKECCVRRGDPDDEVNVVNLTSVCMRAFAIGRAAPHPLHLARHDRTL